jgi:hypothetical protein
MARDYRSKMLGVRLLPALLLVIPLGASATIYQWTDETGHVVLGNQVPETARNVRVVMKEDPAPAPAAANPELEARIARLERQLQAQQYAPPAPYPSAPAAYPPAPPPMPADYYGAGYYPGYGYGYYPYGYGYPVGVTVVRRVRGFAHVSHFASRPAVMHHAAVGRR